MRHLSAAVSCATIFTITSLADATPPKWEGWFPSNYKITLLDGTAKTSTAPEGMTLEGTVTISTQCGGVPSSCVAPGPPAPFIPVPAPSIAAKLTLRAAAVTAVKKGSIELARNEGSGASASTRVKAAPGKVVTKGSVAGGPTVEASGYTQVSGKGEVELALVSTNATVASIKLKSSDLTIRGEANGVLHVDTTEQDALSGCRTTTSDTLTVSEIKGTLKTSCEHYTLDRVFTLNSSSAAGTVKVVTFGQTLDGTFNGPVDGWAKVTASWTNPGTSWKTIPGTQDRAEYRIVKPRVAAETNGVLLHRMTLSAERIEVRSKENKPDGSPWMSAQLSSPSVTIGGDGRGALRLASLPTPVDAFKTSRETCVAAATKLAPPDNPGTKDVNERNVFIDAQTALCERTNPRPPPPIPTPPTVTVDATVKLE